MRPYLDVQRRVKATRKRCITYHNTRALRYGKASPAYPFLGSYQRLLDFRRIVVPLHFTSAGWTIELDRLLSYMTIPQCSDYLNRTYLP